MKNPSYVYSLSIYNTAIVDGCIRKEDIQLEERGEGQVRSHRSFIESKALSSEGTQQAVAPSTYVAEALTGHLNH